MMIVRCRRLLWSAAARRLDAVGESVHLYRLLSELARSGPSPQCELAAATAQHPAAVSRLVDELAAARLVRRRRGHHDRRQIIVAITARGRARFAAAQPTVTAAIEEVMTPLPPRDQRRLAQLLGKLFVAEERPVPRPTPARPPRAR